jgi:hypothetical protein
MEGREEISRLLAKQVGESSFGAKSTELWKRSSGSRDDDEVVDEVL